MSSESVQGSQSQTRLAFGITREALRKHQDPTPKILKTGCSMAWAWTWFQSSSGVSVGSQSQLHCFREELKEEEALVQSLMSSFLLPVELMCFDSIAL